MTCRQTALKRVITSRRSRHPHTEPMHGAVGGTHPTQGCSTGGWACVMQGSYCPAAAPRNLVVLAAAGPGVTSATITVTLSGPPAWLAASMSSRTVSAGEPVCGIQYPDSDFGLGFGVASDVVIAMRRCGIR